MRKIIGLVFISVLFCQPAIAAPVHPCVADAHKMALKLLRFHYDETGHGAIEEGKTKVLKSFKNPARRKKSASRFDVIEVRGWVYKAGYRMRMIYHQDNSTGCSLVGQEILEWLQNEK